MENNFENENDFTRNELLKKYYKPKYKNLFNKIKGIKIPVKNDILKTLLDGEWHSERELVRIAKKQQYMGAVTLGTMIQNFNNNMKSTYLEKRFVNGEMFYKISDNYVGLSRAAYSKYRI